MTSVAPEAIVEARLGSDRAAIDAAIFSDPFYVPFDQLANVDGWVVWLGHPPVPDGIPLLPISEHLLWDDPMKAIATSLLVAADYATRRGAVDAESARTILKRECPIAIVVPGELHRSIESVLAVADMAGVPILRQMISARDHCREHAHAFKTRSTIHAVDLDRRHDPAFSFQQRTRQVTIGGNSLSTFVVHNRGKRDRLSITGDLNDVVGIEIGLSGNFATVEATSKLEVETVRIPSFLDGIASWCEYDALSIGWDIGAEPSAESLGETFRVYLKELFGADLVDLRIVFAPEHGGSMHLSEMRVRAAEFRHLRSNMLAELSGDAAATSLSSPVKAD